MKYINNNCVSFRVLCVCVCVCVCVFMRVYLCRGSIIFRSESTTLQPSISHYTLCTKNHIFRFLNILKRWSSSKKLRSNMVFFVLSAKMIFFPKIKILFFRWKMKDGLSQKTKTKTKKHENMIFPACSQMFWKNGLSKKIALEYNFSCIIRKDDISFYWKYDLIL